MHELDLAVERDRHYPGASNRPAVDLILLVATSSVSAMYRNENRHRGLGVGLGQRTPNLQGPMKLKASMEYHDHVIGRHYSGRID